MVTRVNAAGYIAIPDSAPYPPLVSLQIYTVDVSRSHAVRINGRWFVPAPDHTEQFETDWENLASPMPV